MFVRMPDGRSIPCEPALIPFWWEPEGAETFLTQDGEWIRGSRDGDPEELTDVGYIPHREDCRRAGGNRRRN